VKTGNVFFVLLVAAVCWLFAGAETARADKHKFRRVAELEKTPFKVAKQLQAGDKHVIDFGERRNITGLRISDGGGGKYRVYLKR